MLCGRAVLILDIPAELCTVEAVKRLFRTTFSRSAAGNVARVTLNPSRVTQLQKLPPSARHRTLDAKTAAEPMEEVGGIEFYCTGAVGHLLRRVERVFSGRDNGLELVRGFLQLGDHRLLIEGIIAAQSPVTSPASTVPVAQQATTAPLFSPSIPATTPAEFKAITPTEPLQPDLPTLEANDDPTAPPTSTRPFVEAVQQMSAAGATSLEDGGDVSSGHAPSRARSPVGETPHPEPALPSGSNPTVVSLIFRLLYCRPTPGTAAPSGSSRYFRKDFRLTPYIVYQVLRGTYTPLKVRIASRTSTSDGTPITTVLVEFGTQEEAKEATCGLQEAIVELMSALPEKHDIKHYLTRSEEELRALYRYTSNAETLPDDLPPSRFSSLTCSAEAAEARFSVRASIVVGEQFPNLFHRDPMTGLFRGMASTENSHDFLELKSRKELINGLIGPFFNRQIMREDDFEAWHRKVNPRQFGGISRHGVTNRPAVNDTEHRTSGHDHGRRRGRSDSRSSSRSHESRRRRRSPRRERDRDPRPEPPLPQRPQLPPSQPQTPPVGQQFTPQQLAHHQALLAQQQQQALQAVSRLQAIPTGMIPVQIPGQIPGQPGYRFLPMSPQQQQHLLLAAHAQTQTHPDPEGQRVPPVAVPGMPLHAAAVPPAASQPTTTVTSRPAQHPTHPQLAPLPQGLPPGACLIPVQMLPPQQQQQIMQQHLAQQGPNGSRPPIHEATSLMVYSDQLGVLPLGWRPVFSAEYKQTYYVYRDPAGQERTTWTRPTTAPPPQ